MCAIILIIKMVVCSGLVILEQQIGTTLLPWLHLCHVWSIFIIFDRQSR